MRICASLTENSEETFFKLLVKSFGKEFQELKGESFGNRIDIPDTAENRLQFLKILRSKCEQKERPMVDKDYLKNLLQND